MGNDTRKKPRQFLCGSYASNCWTCLFLRFTNTSPSSAPALLNADNCNSFPHHQCKKNLAHGLWMLHLVKRTNVTLACPLRNKNSCQKTGGGGSGQILGSISKNTKELVIVYKISRLLIDKIKQCRQKSVTSQQKPSQPVMTSFAAVTKAVAACRWHSSFLTLAVLAAIVCLCDALSLWLKGRHDLVRR